RRSKTVIVGRKLPGGQHPVARATTVAARQERRACMRDSHSRRQLESASEPQLQSAQKKQAAASQLRSWPRQKVAQTVDAGSQIHRVVSTGSAGQRSARREMAPSQSAGTLQPLQRLSSPGGVASDSSEQAET